MKAFLFCVLQWIVFIKVTLLDWFVTGGADGIVYLWEINNEKNTTNYVVGKTT